MVARVVSLQGSAAQAGIMVRETLNAGANHVYVFDYSSTIYMTERTSTGASSSYQSLGSGALPYWIKLARSGNAFTMYSSADGVNWLQLGTSQTVSMAQNAYVGLAVSSRTTSSLATANFDNVSVTAAVAPQPTFSLSTSPSSLTVIQGTNGASTITVTPLNGFNSSVSLSASGLPNGVTASFNPSSTASSSTLTLTASSTATTGTFTLTVTGALGSLTKTTTISLTIQSIPTLPSVWSDGDVGAVGLAGSANYANGTFTVAGAGQGTFFTSSDAFHFVYQSLTGDGTMVARVMSLQGSAAQAGIMVRETLNAGANHVYVFDYSSTIYMTERTSTGASSSYQSLGSGALPYWIKLARSGNAFTMYSSADGVNWLQLGTSQTVSMAQNAYVGLAVSSRTTSSLATANFDNVSVTAAVAPQPTFSLSTSPSGLTVIQGTNGASTITVTPLNGFNSSVSLSASGLPSGVTASFNPSSTASSSTLTLTGSSTATTGTFTVTVTGSSGSLTKTTTIFLTVQSIPTLPSVWSDGDIGAVGLAGSANYANGTFTVAGAGQGTFFTSADGFHFVYQSLTGDGTMVARVVSLQGSAAQAGIMVRETLNAGANHVYVFDYSSTIYMTERTSTGASSSYQSLGSGALPYWIKLARSGNVFTMYSSADGVNWLQLGTSQTVSMAQNAYVGLAVSSRTTSALASATFDSVSLSSAAAPAPVITAVSATTGSIGSQVVITGTGFGALQGGSAVLLNGAAVTVSTWSGTSISITIPVGATSGPLLVTIAPSMNDSNAVRFTVTSQPLPVSWLDQDVGVVGLAGSAGYANGTFTVAGSGQGTFFTSSDGFHFVYQSLSGDGTMVARVVSLQGSAAQAGIMVRETRNAGTNHVYVFDYSSTIYMTERSSTGASSSYQSLGSGALPDWIKLARSGNAFTMYSSADGVNWLQLGTSQTVSMAQNAYVGLAVSSRTTSSLATANFDNVSVTAAVAPQPTFSLSTSPSSLTVIQGTNGASTITVTPLNGFNSSVSLSSSGLPNGVTASFNPSSTASSSTLTLTASSTATTGTFTLTVTGSSGNLTKTTTIFLTVQSIPTLPSVWSDGDIGAVGLAGSANYANGTFTVAGAGQGTFFTSSDGFHFVYQSLTGDGTIVARVMSLQGSAAQAGIMVRETLNAGANHVYVFDYSSAIYMTERTSTGASSSYQSLGSGALPYWIKLARSGNVFTMYSSADGVNWLQLGTSQTVSMAQNAYVGLAVSSRTTSSLATANFDNVSISVP